MTGCFACGRTSEAIATRWVGHPDGSWSGRAPACGDHADPATWDRATDSAFSAHASRYSRLTPAEQAHARVIRDAILPHLLSGDAA